jgi:hypothetical protein
MIDYNKLSPVYKIYGCKKSDTLNRGHFSSFVDRVFPSDQAVFDRFMVLADSLRARFGRDWGIPRDELREAMEAASL